MFKTTHIFKLANVIDFCKSTVCMSKWLLILVRGGEGGDRGPSTHPLKLTNMETRSSPPRLCINMVVDSYFKLVIESCETTTGGILHKILWSLPPKTRPLSPQPTRTPAWQMLLIWNRIIANGLQLCAPFSSIAFVVFWYTIDFVVFCRHHSWNWNWQRRVCVRYVGKWHKCAR